MKKVLAVAFLMLVSFVQAQDWNKTLEDAKKKAVESNQNILIVFSGSDWCAPCIKLDKNVWQSEAFQKEAEKSWELVRADFPRKKANLLSDEQMATNRALAEKYNKEGSFPLVVMVDKTGKVLGKIGFKNVTAEEYIKMLHELEK